MGDIQLRFASLNILLRELMNPIFNEIKHAIYVLLYTTKNNWKMTFQCNNCNERAIIDVLLHACTEHLKLSKKKLTNIYYSLSYLSL